jgi:hypothetical protein
MRTPSHATAGSICAGSLGNSGAVASACPHRISARHIPRVEIANPLAVWIILVMRILGFFLLHIGFAWLCVSALFLPTVITAVTSDTLKVTNRPEPFTPHEVFDLLVAQIDVVHHRAPWIFTPALLMLWGGILVSRRPDLRRACNDHTA